MMALMRWIIAGRDNQGRNTNIVKNVSSSSPIIVISTAQVPSVTGRIVLVKFRNGLDRSQGYQVPFVRKQVGFPSDPLLETRQKVPMIKPIAWLF